MKKNIKKKIGIMLYVFIVTIIILCKESYCYLDPSAMTYLIQVVAGIVITMGSVIGIFFYKIKRFFKNRKKQNSPGENEENSNNESLNNKE